MTTLTSWAPRFVVPTMTALLGLSMVPMTTVTAEEGDASDLLTAITDGTTSFKIRPRYEFVDNDNALDDAHALTVRVALDYTTGSYMDTKAFIGFETTQVIGDQRYNNPVDPEPDYQIVADPEHVELNLVGLKFSGIEDTEIILGRQRIIHDNARFVGNVGWRQNEQTFDALTAKYAGVENLKLEYSLVTQANRIFSEEAPSSSTGAGVTGDDKMLSHLAIGTYKFTDIGTLTGYAYLLDYETKDALDRGTFGARFSGAFKASEELSVIYNAALAQQSDMFDNEADVGEMYYNAELGVKYKGFTAKIGYEVLGGDGTTSFATPLATLHAYNGWADKFLATPVDGLTDLYVMVGGAVPQVDGLGFKAFYHIFGSDNDSIDYGTEFDFVVTYAMKKVDPNWKIGAKAAVFSAEDTGIDTTKFWLWTQWGF